jgi:hypothetical protein
MKAAASLRRRGAENIANLRKSCVFPPVTVLGNRRRIGDKERTAELW